MFHNQLTWLKMFQEFVNWLLLICAFKPSNFITLFIMPRYLSHCLIIINILDLTWQFVNFYYRQISQREWIKEAVESNWCNFLNGKTVKMNKNSIMDYCVRLNQLNNYYNFHNAHLSLCVIIWICPTGLIIWHFDSQDMSHWRN